MLKEKETATAQAQKNIALQREAEQALAQAQKDKVQREFDEHQARFRYTLVTPAHIRACTRTVRGALPDTQGS